MAEADIKEETIEEEKTADDNIVAEESTEDSAEQDDVQAEDDVAESDEKKTLSTEEQLALTQQEAAENLDKWQRSAAEFANFKRRQEERLKLQRDQIKSSVLQGVISSLDDMDLAFQNLPDDLDGQVLGWVEGFRLVQRKLNKVLDDQFVTPIDTSGQFDPNLHEAVSSEESEEHEEGQIIAELRKGYQIGNRVIRPAMVRVAR
ncbi:nucleotide exchange factor GrpE [Anaerolineales bacterium HSG6]|nr:nucleotide exchange factor GrpE [Anaerolineales bacterium HSG6]MDM8532378.1 nucleotide exchange factor GrpE [Anaerolineales bacterium HSG25]